MLGERGSVPNLPPLVLSLAEIGESFSKILDEAQICQMSGWDPQPGRWWGRAPRLLADLGVQADPATATLLLNQARNLLVEFLNEIGAEGKNLAKAAAVMDASALWSPVDDAPVVPLGALQIGEGAPTRIHGPDPATCRALRMIALAVWMDRCGGAAQVERADRIIERAIRKAIAPALPASIIQNSLSTLEYAKKVIAVGDEVGSNALPRLAILVRENPSSALQEFHLYEPSSYPGATLPKLAVDGLRALVEQATWFPVLAEKLVRHLAVRCWEAFRANNYDSLTARELVYVGGWSKLAEEAGINSRYRGDIPRMIALLRIWKGSDGNQHALIYDYHVTEASGRHPSRVTITVGKGLVPGHAAELPRGEGRRLLPVLDLPELQIQGVGKDRAGGLLAYQWELLAALRDVVASEVGGIGNDKAILLPKKLRTLAAERAGLTDKEATAADRVWIGDGPGAWLKPVGEDRVMLMDTRAFDLLSNAEKQAVGRRAGGKSHPKNAKSA